MLNRSRPTNLALALSLIALTLAPAPALADDPPPDNPSGAVPRGGSGAAPQAPPPPQGTPAPAGQVTLPRPLNYVDPGYTEEAQEAGIQGVVTLQIDVSAEGKVLNAVVVGPLDPGLDALAVAAVKKTDFSPARRADGTVFAARIFYKYTFALKIEVKQPDGAPGDTPAARVEEGFSGTVLAAGGDATLAGAKIRVRPLAGGTGTEIVTGEKGSFSFTGLPPGKYEVTVELAGFEPLVVEEEVVKDERTEVKYRLSTKAESGVIDVQVRGAKPPREVTKRTVTAREISRIPGTNGDALRSIQNLPGVARPPAILGLLIVRGSAPQDSQTFIDGTPVPLIYHFGGLSSVVPTEVLDKIDFYPGNFSTQYGRVMGGIVDVGLRSPKDDGKLHGLAQIDLIDARLLVEKTFKIGKYPLKLLAAGRRSYFDAWLGPVLSAAGGGVTQAPVYYDYQLIAETNPTPNSSLRASFFGSDDALSLLLADPAPGEPAISGNAGLHTAFQRVQLRYENQYSQDDSLNTVVAYGHDELGFSVGPLFFNLDVDTITGRLEYSHRFSDSIRLNTGFDIYRGFYTVAFRLPQGPVPGQPPNQPFSTQQTRSFAQDGEAFYPSTYVEAELTPVKGMKLIPGIRLDYYSINDSVDVSPRFAGRYDVHQGFPRTTIKGGVGLFTQPPSFQEITPPLGDPSLVSNRAIHYALGAEQQLTKQVEVSVEGFYKQLDGLVRQGAGVTTDLRTFENKGTGYVVGAETLLKYNPDDRFFGWLAYTLSRSARVNNPGDAEQLASFDQTHILTVLGSYKLGWGFEFGARFRLVSGNLTTPTVCNSANNQYRLSVSPPTAGSPPQYSYVPVCDPSRVNALLHAPSGSYTQIPFGAAASERLPLFHQLDLRLDKRWQFKSWQFSMYLDVQNVYNNANSEGIQYNFNYTARQFVSGLPILPSIGLRGEM
ncbi:MAG: TonB family protein [Polyangiaceae bacterium]